MRTPMLPSYAFPPPQETVTFHERSRAESRGSNMGKKEVSMMVGADDDAGDAVDGLKRGCVFIAWMCGSEVRACTGDGCGKRGHVGG